MIKIISKTIAICSLLFCILFGASIFSACNEKMPDCLTHSHEGFSDGEVCDICGWTRVGHCFYNDGTGYITVANLKQKTSGKYDTIEERIGEKITSHGKEDIESEFWPDDLETSTSSKKLIGLYIRNTIKKIERYGIGGYCPDVKFVVFESDSQLTSLDYYVFDGYYALQEIVLPKGVKIWSHNGVSINYTGTDSIPGGKSCGGMFDRSIKVKYI